ncbi:13088_t:CDS:2, partial [Funneliformis geosporum]
LDANGNKCRTYYVNDGSTENAINLLLNNYEITNDSKKNQNQTTLSTIVKIQKHKENPTFVISEEKGIKKIISNSYSSSHKYLTGSNSGY